MVVQVVHFTQTSPPQLNQYLILLLDIHPPTPTTDCNKFAADDTLGTGSLRAQKDGTTYRVTGMISFGSIKMGDASGRTTDKAKKKTVVLEPGQIGVQEYLEQIRERNAKVQNAEGIISSIEEELNNIAGTINRTIEMIEQDPEIQFCVSGRDLSQITGKKGDRTTARYPNLLNSVKPSNDFSTTCRPSL